ncbi:hypothetical protein C8R45DRAFT_528137 [Mycena sanguinolenta]|nr:hypothetical protein C8R45DRAFT_1037129 [Mycena sanguinolenta]KAJ6462625.1 hypothetical protein C8R45DRAFT_528137 [Mycena sanguinolenta]
MYFDDFVFVFLVWNCARLLLLRPPCAKPLISATSSWILSCAGRMLTTACPSVPHPHGHVISVLNRMPDTRTPSRFQPPPNFCRLFPRHGYSYSARSLIPGAARPFRSHFSFSFHSSVELRIHLKWNLAAGHWN